MRRTEGSVVSRYGSLWRTVLTLPVLWIALAGTGSAQSLAELAGQAQSLATAIDTVWVLVAAFLVFFMQAGFAMVEAGLTRAKNAGNIVMKNLMDFAAGSLAYWAVGFAIMFGAGNAFLGTSGFFLSGDWSFLGLHIPIEAFWLFQTVFAGTAATIISGAMAERTRFTGYLAYSIVISGLIYPVVGHWTWGGGWLSTLGSRGFVDFAGSTVVHSVGAWAALAGTMVVGPRIGKYNADGSVNPLPGHSITLAALGVFILWFGWFGFNPGSTLSGTDPAIARIAANTGLAAAAGGTLAMLSSWIRYGKPDVAMTLNGTLAGLVGITAGATFVEIWAAVLIGAASGVLVVFGVEFFDRVHVDDAVGAISVHGLAGALGTLAVGLLATDGGLFYGGGIEQLLVQLAGVLAVFVWAFGATFLVFKLIAATVGLRVTPDEETMGLDLGEHGVTAYPDWVPLQTPRRSPVETTGLHRGEEGTATV